MSKIDKKIFKFCSQHKHGNLNLKQYKKANKIKGKKKALLSFLKSRFYCETHNYD